MKYAQLFGIGIVVALCSTSSADPILPGKVDFGTFKAPANGAEYVEVNLPSNLISLAAKFVEKQEPDVAKLLNGIKSVSVNVVGLNDANRGEMDQKIQKVRADLAGSGWERIVTAQKEGQDVGVYLKMDEKSVIQGLTVTVRDGKKAAVFINVVGDIRPEQLTTLGEKLNIQPLKEMGIKPEKSEATDK